jgi:hypothetical protein
LTISKHRKEQQENCDSCFHPDWNLFGMEMKKLFFCQYIFSCQ